MSWVQERMERIRKMKAELHSEPTAALNSPSGEAAMGVELKMLYVWMGMLLRSCWGHRFYASPDGGEHAPGTKQVGKL